MKKIIITIIITLFSIKIHCQKIDSIIIINEPTKLPIQLQKKTTTNEPQASGDSKVAKIIFDIANYKEALKEYIYLNEKYPNNPEYLYKLGVCYLKTNVDKSKSISLLEKASTTSEYSNDAMLWYYLGEAYMYDYRFDDAIKAFNKFKNLSKGKENVPLPADRKIEMCQNAKILITKPVRVTFENLGPLINSNGPDYNAFVPEDESFIVFSSKRNTNMGKVLDYDGFNTPDIYWNVLKNDNFQKTKNIGPLLNTELVEEVVWLSHDGEYMLMYYDNNFGNGDIFYSQKKGKTFQKAQPYPYNVNSKYNEPSACLSKNKDTIYFASDNPEISYGGTDIFYSVLMPNGHWGAPVNLGKEINTPYNENFPNLSSDGLTLYFASEGHNSMGGYDIFKSQKDPKTGKWSTPVNLGYPINSPLDETTISFNRNRKYAYISKFFKDKGYGDLDIYKINFLDIKPLYSLVNCYLTDANGISVYDLLAPSKDSTNLDSTNFAKKDTNVILNFTIKAYSSDSALVGIYKLDNVTKRFSVYLPTGEYKLHITGHGYDCITKLVIPEKSDYKPQFKTNIVIYKKEEQPKTSEIKKEEENIDDTETNEIKE